MYFYSAPFVQAILNITLKLYKRCDKKCQEVSHKRSKKIGSNISVKYMDENPVNITYVF